MTTKKDAKSVKRYQRAALLKDRRFAGCQGDFLAAILTEETYTIEEAEAKVKAFLERGE